MNVTDYWKTSPYLRGDGWWTEQLEEEFRLYIKHWSTVVPNNPILIDANAVLRTVKHAVLFASYIAFTDWNTSLRRMSVQFSSRSTILNGGVGGNINAKNNFQIFQQFFSARSLPERLF